MSLLYSAWARACALLPSGRGTTSFWPPANMYDAAAEVPDQAGKVVIVTGGASGIGREVARQLLHKQARVYLAGRGPGQVEAAIAALEEETGRRALPLLMDLGDLPSVARAAGEFLGNEERLDVLYCNAGMMVPPTDLLTTQNYDLQFGTHVLGHYLLARLLLPALQRSTALTGAKARVVHTASAGYAGAPAAGVEYVTLTPSAARDALLAKWGRLMAPWTLFGQSKLGVVLVANWFERVHGGEVVSCSVHPGFVHSRAGRHGSALQEWILSWLRWPTELGAVNLLWAGTSPEGEGLGGKYVIPWTRLATLDARATDELAQDRLVAWLDTELAPWLR